MELKELEAIKNKFKVNHASRMADLVKAIESSREAQKPETKEKETKNTKTLAQLNDLLASL